MSGHAPRTLGRVAFLHVRTKTLTALATALALAAAGCSGGSKPRATTSTTSSPTTLATTTTTTTTPPRPAPKLVGKGLPADLLATVRPLYLGGAVRAAAPVGAALAKRRPFTQNVAVAGSVGSWKGTPIAVLTHGSDVTLLQKVHYTWSVVGGWWPSLGVGRRVPATTMRVLSIGSDARPNQRPDAARGDALHIIGVDAKGVGGMVGIPRDSWVPLSVGGTSKINAALIYGGPKAMVKTVQSNTGVPIDGYVLTGFKGFKAMINAMGGLRYVSSVALKGVDGHTLLKVGTNLLDGPTALGFARERHHLANGDFGRSANQGLIIRAGMMVAKQAGPAALPKYLTAIGANVTTDLTAAEVLNLSAAIYVTDLKSLHNEVAQGSVGMRSGQSVVLLGGSAQSLFRDIRDGRLG